MRIWWKFIRMPLQKKQMILEALVLSGYYRIQILLRPFAKLSPSIGTLGYETEKEDRQDIVLYEVSHAVAAVCSRTPWESKCLVQALTAKKMLNRRGFPCTLYMGVALDEKGEMKAHAWLRCGNGYVTGGRGAQKFTVTTVYGDREEE